MAPAARKTDCYYTMCSNLGALATICCMRRILPKLAAIVKEKTVADAAKNQFFKLFMHKQFFLKKAIATRYMEGVKWMT